MKLTAAMIAAVVLVLVGTATARSSSTSISKPRLIFERVCDPLSYNGLYLKHQLSLPLRIDRYAANFQLLAIQAVTDIAFLNSIQESKIQVMVQLLRQPGRADLIFLCPTFSRCQQLKEAIESNPEAVWRSVQFSMTGRIGSQKVLFEALRTENLPSFVCDPSRWVVFQRRLDGNLSFAQNWDAYVNGFGSPDSNYWMGLDPLFRATATAAKSSYPETSRCRLRVELQDFSGRNYWGEYGMFQVLDPGQNYRLRLGKVVAGSQLQNFVETHSESPFSTFDRDNDQNSESCSQFFGYGGWWYKNCHTVNLNGAYLTDMSITESPIYASFNSGGKLHIVVKKSIMSYKC